MCMCLRITVISWLEMEDTSPIVSLTVPVCARKVDGSYVRVFESAKAAGEELGVLKCDITHCCRGRRKNVLAKSGARFIFEYVDEMRDLHIEEKPGSNWKPCVSRAGYEVSDLGQVKNSTTGRILHPRNGTYQQVHLYDGGEGEPHTIHRLMAEAWLGPPPVGKTQVNHKDGEKHNNVITNLEWATPSENQRHAIDVLHKQPPGEKPVGQFDQSGRMLRRYKSMSEAARDQRVHRSSMHAAICGRNKTCKGFIWRYYIDAYEE